MNGYDLSRKWFDWCFENPEKIKPNHTALYFFAIEHCNRLGWKKKYGLPSIMTMEAIGIKSHHTYMNTFNDLEEWGFINVIERSRNQYSANIIALSNFDKALDKALIKHGTKQCQSTSESIDSIDKPITNKQTNQVTKEQRELTFREQVAQHTTYESSMLDSFADYWTESNEKGKNMKFEMQKTFDIVRRLKTWSNNGFDNKKPKNEPTNFDSVVWSASDIEKHMNDPFLSDEYKAGFIADLKAKNQLPTNYLKLGP